MPRLARKRINSPHPLLLGVLIILPTQSFAAVNAGVCYQDCAAGYCPFGEVSYTCTCENGHQGPDCSVRRCPIGKAWTFGDANSTDHSAKVECSNMGSCNTTSGLCTCRSGFYGAACQYMDCPNSCSGHGQCMTRQEFEYHNFRGLGTSMTGGTDWVSELSFDYTDWDADMVQACICDAGWEGYDCSTMNLCPKGDDPLTQGQVNEMQILECTCSDGTCDTETFRLGFRRTGIFETVEWTGDISALATASEFEEALVALKSIDGVFLQVGGLAASSVDPICDSSGESTGITFTHTPGNLEPLMAVSTSGSLVLDVLVDGELSTMTGGADQIQSVTGTREYITCSGRGYCVDGEYCSCFDNFASSSGALGDEGGLADCGFFTGTSPTDDDCPQSMDGSVCFGRGTCVGYAKVCVCDPGYVGRLCQARECEASTSFFAYQSGADHDSTFYCSNRGSCDVDTGSCECMAGFEGDACDVLSCPVNETSGSECGDHGTCASLQELAATYGSSYTTAWDATLVKGCTCESDVYVGPFTGETSDYSGYLCDQLSCPFGDDPVSVDVIESAECSNRGTCDRTTGHCSCFPGFCSSNGTGFAGTVGDCGFKSIDCNSA